MSLSRADQGHLVHVPRPGAECHRARILGHIIPPYPSACVTLRSRRRAARLYTHTLTRSHTYVLCVKSDNRDMKEKNVSRGMHMTY